MMRALWPLVRQWRLFRLRWLQTQMPAHDMRQPELIVERRLLELSE